jgi:hypothetical protein
VDEFLVQVFVLLLISTVVLNPSNLDGSCHGRKEKRTGRIISIASSGFGVLKVGACTDLQIPAYLFLWEEVLADLFLSRG